MRTTNPALKKTYSRVVVVVFYYTVLKITKYKALIKYYNSDVTHNDEKSMRKNSIYISQTLEAND